MPCKDPQLSSRHGKQDCGHARCGRGGVVFGLPYDITKSDIVGGRLTRSGMKKHADRHWFGITARAGMRSSGVLGLGEMVMTDGVDGISAMVGLLDACDSTYGFRVKHRSSQGASLAVAWSRQSDRWFGDELRRAPLSPCRQCVSRCSSLVRQREGVESGASLLDHPDISSFPTISLIRHGRSPHPHGDHAPPPCLAER